LVYRGSYTEETVGKGVQFNRSYRLETRVLVLETRPQGIDVAFYTVLKLRSPRSDLAEPAPHSVRLELAGIDLQGRITPEPGVSLAIPLDGPATVECGPFVESPRRLVGAGQSWQVLEADRPPQVWKVIGAESVNGTRCLKLEGLQRSDDWNQPRADRASWQRRDTVWLSLDIGVAYKVERVIEGREPAHQNPTQRFVAQYELESNIQYPGQLFEDRRREILQARKFDQALAPLTSNPSKFGHRPFDVILAKIGYYLESEPRTPYRDAVLQVKRRVEAARRGEVTPVAFEDTAHSARATPGQRAPDFVVTNLLTKESVRLQKCLGRPILMVFYTPKSQTAEAVLRYCQRLQDSHSGNITVLAFALFEDIEQVKRQYADLKLSVPILSGGGLRQNYEVEATPKLVVIDSQGLVRTSYIGWGPETSSAVGEELKQCLSGKVLP
jgi:hypothetical protein